MMPHSVRTQAGLYSIDYWVPLGIVLFSEQKRRTHVFARSRRLVWPLPGIPSGHNPFPPAFKVACASPASARRMRATCLSLWERCPAGAERACLPSQSLRDSSPRVGAEGRTDCHTSDVGHWFAMTCAVRRFLKNFVRPHPPDRHLPLPREGFSPFTLH